MSPLGHELDKNGLLSDAGLFGEAGLGGGSTLGKSVGDWMPGIDGLPGTFRLVDAGIEGDGEG